MIQNRSKHLITVVMWVALAAFMIAVVVNAASFRDEWIVIPLTMIPVLFGFLVTLGLWSPAIFPWIDTERLRALHGDAQADAQTSKPKRQQARPQHADDERLGLLMSLLTPDEQERLKADLRRHVLENATVSEDGEIEYRGLSMYDLLEENAAQQRRG